MSVQNNPLEVTVFDLAAISPKFVEERRKMHKYASRNHPAAKKAAKRAHNRMHRLIQELSADIHGLILMADGLCGDHAAAVVLFPSEISRQRIYSTACQNIGVIGSIVGPTVPGEWYKVYCHDPAEQNGRLRRLC